MMIIDHNKIVEALRTIKNPINRIDIIQSKIVSNLQIKEQNISFTLDLAQMDDQVKQQLNFKCIEVINTLYPGANVNIHVADQKGGAKNPLPQVKNIIAVASGKGGVGKSTISVNVAKGLQQAGYKVGILDADLYGPSIPTMLGVKGQRPKVEMLYGKHKIVPIDANGLYVMSIGFVVEPEQAVVLRGPRLGGIMKQFIHDCLWPALDFLIIDLPPGTGDIQLTLVQTVPVTGALIVTTPQDVAVIDAVKAVNMFLLENVNVPILGVIENMSWFIPAELPDHKYEIFGQGGGQKLAEVASSKLLGQIPLVMDVRIGGDTGAPIIEQDENIAQKAFKETVENLIAAVEMRNNTLDPTQTVKMN